MPLLHLPLEVFQNIIEAYVADSGVLVAWQSRLTCSELLSLPCIYIQQVLMLM